MNTIDLKPFIKDYCKIMTQATRPNQPRQPNQSNQQSQSRQGNQSRQSNQNRQAGQGDQRHQSEQNIINQLDNLNNWQTLKDYPIRELVTHSEEFGKYLKNQGLKTNQIRKFLDAINRLKVKINLGDNDDLFEQIKPEIVLLKPKLAYAAARERAAKPLSNIISKAIDKVHSLDDFNRLVNLIESIIAYHKAQGGE
jgi:CRISPR-associated protein Csm2